ncbi:antirestriction protein [Xenorhabdus bovienii]|nr:antirestriction protein [Xenorhabdus bovienii]MDE9589752.1 antirestriction protein [Xenorhabdus bovienii]
MTATAIVLTRIARSDESNNEAFRFSALQEYALRHPKAGLIQSVLALKTGETFIDLPFIHNKNNHH